MHLKWRTKSTWSSVCKGHTALEWGCNRHSTGHSRHPMRSHLQSSVLICHLLPWCCGSFEQCFVMQNCLNVQNQQQESCLSLSSKPKLAPMPMPMPTPKPVQHLTINHEGNSVVACTKNLKKAKFSGGVKRLAPHMVGHHCVQWINKKQPSLPTKCTTLFLMCEPGFTWISK